jgi:hypothetical protein
LHPPAPTTRDDRVTSQDQQTDCISAAARSNQLLERIVALESIVAVLLLENAKTLAALAGAGHVLAALSDAFGD